MTKQADVDAAVPVTLLTGFLGAGKTTLVNQVLARRAGERIAVVVNEFGDVGIDGSLIVRSDEEVVELANGCVCCTVRSDLVQSLGGLLKRRARRWFRGGGFERVLIETSGLASPGPVQQTIGIAPELRGRLETRGVITLVNAERIHAELERHPEVEEQVGYADLLVVNHADQVGTEDLAGVHAALEARNPLAARHVAVRAELDIDVLAAAEAAALGRTHAPEENAPVGAHAHTEGARSIVFRAEEELDLHALKIWIQHLCKDRSHELWRLKGVLNCRQDSKAIVVQGVYQFLELGPGDTDPPQESILVLIGRGFDQAALERGWERVRTV